MVFLKIQLLSWASLSQNSFSPTILVKVSLNFEAQKKIKYVKQAHREAFSELGVA